MLTAIISTAIVGALAAFGVKLSIVQIAGVAIAVEIVIVGGILGLAAKYYKGKAAAEPKPVEAPDQ